VKQTAAGMAWVHSALTDQPNDQAQNHLDFECMAMFEAGDDAEEFLRYNYGCTWEHLSEVNACPKQMIEGKKFNFEGA
jgi:hypothetical protein